MPVASLLAVSSVTAIRVPVTKNEDNASASVLSANEPNQPIYYTQEDINLPTYLIPPDTQRQEEVILDVAPKLATYLLPPSTGKQSDYYYDGTGTAQQSDWYPIAKVSQNSPDVVPIILPELNETEALKIIENVRNGKALQHEQFSLPTPSTKLEPPALNAPNEYVVLNSDEVELPVNAYKVPTKLYPKKYTEGFTPVPIPVSQFVDDYSSEIPKARPLKPFHPILSVNDEYAPSDDKKSYLYEQLEKGRKESEAKSPEKHHSTSDESYEDQPFKPQLSEQETSESHLRYPERSEYAAPLGQDSPRPAALKIKEHPPPPPGERTEFRMHGMKGPHSYQFGYDTGKGKNRQFRYEERDNDGHVRGHYGYVGKNGKLRVVNYDADPEHGFRAQEPVEKDE
ncbi:unnamed protein product, partial [Iphiclides podalirius]